MKNNTKHIKKSGFTAIELMLAIVILGGMLTLTMTVIVGMLRFYVFSNSVRKNQANGRDTLDLITRDVRFGKLILPSSSGATTNQLCAYDKTNKKITFYALDTTTYDLNRKVYNYNADVDPTSCVTDVLNTDLLVQQSSTKLNLDKMKVTKFNIKRTQGASFQVNTNAAAVLIDYEFLTGNANTSGTACDSNNIFCSKLGYDTAINLRGND